MASSLVSMLMQIQLNVLRSYFNVDICSLTFDQHRHIFFLEIKNFGLFYERLWHEKSQSVIFKSVLRPYSLLVTVETPSACTWPR